jgi:adenylate cyclase
LKPLAVAAAHAGFLNGVPDTDGVLRRIPLLIELNGRVYPSLSVAAVAMGTGSRDAALSVMGPNHGSLSLGQLLVPLDGRSNLLLRYRGPRRTFRHISAADVIAEQAPVTSIRDKIVFVGTTALGHAQSVATPLDTSFVGIEVQATVADNLLQQNFVYRPVKGAMLESLVVVGLGLTVTLLAATLGLSAAALTALVMSAALWAGAVWLLSTSGAFLSPFYPTAGVILAFIFVTLVKVGIERRRAETAIRKIESTILNR